MGKPTAIQRLGTITQFNTERGQATHHPLISVLDQNYSSPFFPQRYFSELYIVFLKQAECEGISYGRGAYLFSRDSLLFIAPGQVMSFHSSEEYRPHGWALAFHPDLLAGQGLSPRDHAYFGYEMNKALPVTAEEKERLIALFRQLKCEADSFAPDNSAAHDDTNKIIARYLDLILHICDRIYQQLHQAVKRPSSDLLVRLERELDNYLKEDKLQSLGLPTVRYFADSLHISPNYFGDVIKRQTGMSAKAYLEKWLTSVAKQKIADTSLNVSQIAYQLGFSHPQHFTRFFKRNVGMSPTQYR